MDTAQEGRRRKSGDIADHTAAECNEQVRTSQSCFTEILIDRCNGIQIFVLLARGDDGIGDRQRELCTQGAQVQRFHIGVRNHMDTGRDGSFPATCFAVL